MGLRNLNWLFFEKAVKLLVGIPTTAFVVRMLGPADYGILTYGVVFYSLFAYFSSYAVDSIIIQKIVDGNSDSNKSNMGGYLLAKAFYAFVAGLLLLAIVLTLKYDSAKLIVIVTIIASRLIFQPVYVIDCYFEANGFIEPVARTRIFSYFISTLLKVLFVYLEFDLIFIALSITFESMLTALTHLYQYRKYVGKTDVWIYDRKLAGKVVRESAPVLMTSGLLMAANQIDKVILAEYYDFSYLGLYSVSSQFVQYFMLFPSVIFASFFPSIMRNKSINFAIYSKEIKRLTFIFFLVGLIISIVISIGADFLLKVIYGDQFSGARNFLVIQIWSLPFLFLLLIRSRLLISIGMQKVDSAIFFLTFLTCAILDLILIPFYGATGACWAWIFGLILALIVYPYFFGISILFQDFLNEKK